MAVNYNASLETEARGFIKALTGNDVPAGKDNVQKALKDGRILAE